MISKIVIFAYCFYCAGSMQNDIKAHTGVGASTPKPYGYFIMKEIILYGGPRALVDDIDYEYLNQFKWNALKLKHTTYAIRSITKNGKNNTIRMHREIMGFPNGLDVDHIDNDGLNNTRSNLRCCTRSQNNSNKHNVTGNSKYKGVSRVRAITRKIINGTIKEYDYGYKYHAYINHNYKRTNIGWYKTEIEAALAYNEYAIKYFGEFAHLNVIS